MAKQYPIIPAGVVIDHDATDVDIEGFVWPQSAKRQERAGKLAAILDSEGGVVAYQRLLPKMDVALLREEESTEARRVLPVMERSQASITPKEMLLYACRQWRGEQSQTAGLSERERELRRHKTPHLSDAQILAGKRVRTGAVSVEDRMERLVAKVDAFGASRLVGAR